MDLNSSIGEYLKKLSKIISNESDGIIGLLPSSGEEKEESLLNFLSHSSELFSNSFCFRPLTTASMARTKGEYLAVVRKIKKSNMAIIIRLLRTGPTREANNSFYKTTYQMSVCEFDLIKSIGDISNYRELAKQNCRLINCRDRLEAQYTKKEYGWLTSKRRKFFKIFFKGGKKEELMEKIFSGLQKLEEGIKWFIENNIVTMR